MIREAIFQIRERWAKERIEFFIQTVTLKEEMRILDLGGYNGSLMERLEKRIPNLDITIADINKEALKIAADKGFKTMYLNGENRLPFADNEFDCIFCNSVIEHVTLPKEDIWDVKNHRKFKEKSLLVQKQFSNEILRCSKNYFVQTPHKYFPLESHTWFPFVGFMHRPLQIVLIKLLNIIWIKRTSPDWNLLSKKDMKELFPNSKITIKKKIGFPKEIIATNISRTTS